MRQKTLYRLYFNSSPQSIFLKYPTGYGPRSTLPLRQTELIAVSIKWKTLRLYVNVALILYS
ncbi:hypothetical protein T09_5016 [Trichinella sp. T9]|nr:hypothetical protein T09_5016 [Trichinella sp. T9]